MVIVDRWGQGLEFARAARFAGRRLEPGWRIESFRGSLVGAAEAGGTTSRVLRAVRAEGLPDVRQLRTARPAGAELRLSRRV